MKCLGNPPIVGRIEFSPTEDESNPKDSPLRKELNALKEQFGKFRDKFEELAELVRSLEEHDRFYHGGNSDDE